MPASPAQDEAAPNSAELGLNRGRRVLAVCCLAGLIFWAGHALSLVVEHSSASQQPGAVAGGVSTAREDIELAALRRAPQKRRPKAARGGSHVALRPSTRGAVEPTLSAPPLVAAVLDARPVVTDLAAGDPVEVSVAAAAAEAAPAAESAPTAAATEDSEAGTLEDTGLALEPADNGNGEAIARAIAAQKVGAVQACFERELKQTPTLRGNLTVELDLAPPHRVNRVRVTDDLERPAFTDCVSSTMQHLSFVELNEEVSVRVPYILSARQK